MVEYFKRNLELTETLKYCYFVKKTLVAVKRREFEEDFPDYYNKFISNIEEEINTLKEEIEKSKAIPLTESIIDQPAPLYYWPHDNIDINDLIKILVEQEIINDSDIFKEKFKTSRAVKNKSLTWNLGVTECFYFLYMVLGGEHYKGIRIDSIAFKLFEFTPSKSKVQISSNFSQFSRRTGAGFDEYVEKKHSRIKDILSEIGIQ